MKYKTAFRLALRAIGVLVLAQIVPGFLQTVTQVVLQWVLSSSSSGAFFPWAYAMSGVLGYGVGIGVGLYLFFGGRWVIDRVIPSNRPYCAECGYELTDLPADYRCPECGVPYRQTGSALPVEPPLPSA